MANKKNNGRVTDFGLDQREKDVMKDADRGQHIKNGYVPIPQPIMPNQMKKKEKK